MLFLVYSTRQLDENNSVVDSSIRDPEQSCESSKDTTTQAAAEVRALDDFFEVGCVSV